MLCSEMEEFYFISMFSRNFKLHDVSLQNRDDVTMEHGMSSKFVFYDT